MKKKKGVKTLADNKSATVTITSNKITIINNAKSKQQNENIRAKKKEKQKRKPKKNISTDSPEPLSNIPGQFVMNPLKRKIDETASLEECSKAASDNDSQPSKKNKKKRKKKADSNIGDTMPIGVKDKKTNNTNSTNMKPPNKQNLKKQEQKMKSTDKVVSETVVKINAKKERIKQMLEMQRNRSNIDGSGNSGNLRQRMLEKLKCKL